MARERRVFLGKLQFPLSPLNRIHVLLRRKLVGFALLLSLSLMCVLSLPGLATSVAPSITQSTDLLQQARQQYEQGQLTEALQTLQQAEREASSDPARRAAALSNLGRVQFALGQWQPALEAFQQAEKLYTQVSDRPEAIRSRIQQAEVLRARGDNIRAITLLTQLKQTLNAQSAGLELEKAQTLRILAEVLLAKGETLPDGADSAALLQQSRDAVASLNAPQEASAIAFSSGEVKRIAINRKVYADIRGGLDTAGKLQAALSLADGEIPAALQDYQEAIASAPTPLTAVQAQLRQLKLLIENIQIFTNLQQEAQSDNSQSLQTEAVKQLDTEIRQLSDRARKLAQPLPPQIDRLPVSAASVEARINFAALILQGVDRVAAPQRGNRTPPTQETSTPPKKQAPPPKLLPSSLLPIAQQMLITAARQAKTLQNPALEAQALGSLSSVYIQTNQWQNAEKLTNRALLLVQQKSTPNTPELWGQLGKIRVRNGDTDGARTAYKAAIDNLKAQRQDRVANNPDVQYDFLEQVQPIYREYVRLLLSQPNPTQADLRQAIEQIDGLQIAELDDFFREACLSDREVPLEKLVDQNPNTAFIFPIILSEQTFSVIAKIPKQADLRYQSTTLPAGRTITETLKQFRDLLRDESRSQDVEARTIATTLYNGLVAPFEEQLSASGVNTLIFVLDGELRSVPMAALYNPNSKKYLVQEYAIAVSLASQLLDSAPGQETSTLAAGLIDVPSQYNLSPLKGVKQEIERIQDLGVLTRPALLEKQFTSKNLAEELSTSPFNIVLHLATHGQFSSRKEDTYVLMADGFIKIDQLSQILRRREQNRQPAIGLLVLSACETAQGDSRAALGLSGIAVRSGVRSALGSLWVASDDSTPRLINQFYTALQANRKQGAAKLTKAQALQQAQVDLLQSGSYSSPFFWAPFVLVGDWL